MINAVLFDLDGTLLDTAPDIAYVLNKLRSEFGHPTLPFDHIRPLISFGSKWMVKEIIGINEDQPHFQEVRARFFDLYQQHLTDHTRFFPDMEKVLLHLDNNHIPWGIVTNKLTRHTTILLKALGLDHRAVCIICGDTLPTFKPAPEPILHACELLNQPPQHCLYIGDSEVDVLASKAAGIKCVVALYGYINNEAEAYNWQADGYIRSPIELLDQLKT